MNHMDSQSVAHALPSVSSEMDSDFKVPSIHHHQIVDCYGFPISNSISFNTYSSNSSSSSSSSIDSECVWINMTRAWIDRTVSSSSSSSQELSLLRPIFLDGIPPAFRATAYERILDVTMKPVLDFLLEWRDTSTSSSTLCVSNSISSKQDTVSSTCIELCAQNHLLPVSEQNNLLYQALLDDGKFESDVQCVQLETYLRVDVPRVVSLAGLSSSLNYATLESPGFASLIRICRAISRFHLSHPIIQGYSTVVAYLCAVLSPISTEERVFSIVCHLLHRSEWQLHRWLQSSSSQSLAGSNDFVFASLIRHHLPRVFESFGRFENIPSGSLTTALVALPFAKLPFATRLRCMDAMMAEGPAVVFKAALTLIKQREGKLDQNDVDGVQNIQILIKNVSESQQEFDCQAFFLELFHDMDAFKKQIEILRADYEESFVREP